MRTLTTFLKYILETVVPHLGSILLGAAAILASLQTDDVLNRLTKIEAKQTSIEKEIKKITAKKIAYDVFINKSTPQKITKELIDGEYGDSYITKSNKDDLIVILESIEAIETPDQINMQAMTSFYEYNKILSDKEEEIANILKVNLDID